MEAWKDTERPWLQATEAWVVKGNHREAMIASHESLDGEEKTEKRPLLQTREAWIVKNQTQTNTDKLIEYCGQAKR